MKVGVNLAIYVAAAAGQPRSGCALSRAPFGSLQEESGCAAGKSVADCTSTGSGEAAEGSMPEKWAKKDVGALQRRQPP